MLLNRVRSVLPPECLHKLRNLRRIFRHLKWRAETTIGGTFICKAEIVAQLQSLGVSEGQDLMVHSSLSRVGIVEGGADAVVDALLQAIGETGTLLMPAYPMKGSMFETMKDGCSFDVLNTASTMGKLTETLRARPGSLRSAHPTHSVVALGPRAAIYVEQHHMSIIPFGPLSPFWLLAEYNGGVLCLGSGIGKVSSHHVIENMGTVYPLKVYLPDVYNKPVKLANGQVVDVETLVHDPTLAAVRIDSNKNIEIDVLEDMRRAGIVREGMIGQANAHLFDAASLNELHKKRLAKGKTIYATT